MSEVVSKVEDLLAHLLCADAAMDKQEHVNARLNNSGGEFVSISVGAKLNFEPMHPRKSYTSQINSDGRCYALNASLLLNSVQDIIGNRAEIALATDKEVKWAGIRKIQKRPRGVWVSSPRACLYEFHSRTIYKNGFSNYYSQIVAISKEGNPVQCIVEGSKSSFSQITDSEFLILAASLIEDAHRPDVLTATVSEGSSIVVPVPIGEHKEVFSLRDAPLTPAGRRKAILHWVAKHMRKTKEENKPSQVKAHWRGVREVEIDGFKVSLSSNVA